MGHTHKHQPILLLLPVWQQLPLPVTLGTLSAFLLAEAGESWRGLSAVLWGWHLISQCSMGVTWMFLPCSSWELFQGISHCPPPPVQFSVCGSCLEKNKDPEWCSWVPLAPQYTHFTWCGTLCTPVPLISHGKLSSENNPRVTLR